MPLVDTQVGGRLERDAQGRMSDNPVTEQGVWRGWAGLSPWGEVCCRRGRVRAQGRAVRGAFGREAAGAGVAPNAGKRAGQKPPQRYNRETGEKERYFADDDKVGRHPVWLAGGAG